MFMDETDLYPESIDRAELNSRIQQGFALSWKRKLQSWETMEGRKLTKNELEFREALHKKEEQKTFKRIEMFDWFNDMWAGPIDKYGMSWYVGSKMTSVGTMIGAAIAIRP
eukprot:UN02244